MKDYCWKYNDYWQFFVGKISFGNDFCVRYLVFLEYVNFIRLVC